MNIDMDDRMWENPLSSAYVLKTFLLELPEPLIPFHLYEAFINLAGKRWFHNTHVSFNGTY